MYSVSTDKLYFTNKVTQYLFSITEGKRHTEYFTNYGIYFKQRLLLCLHFYNKLHIDHLQMSLINTIEHFSTSSITFS